MAQKYATMATAVEDPKPLYYQGTALAFAGKKEGALHMIHDPIGDKTELLRILGAGE